MTLLGDQRSKNGRRLGAKVRPRDDRGWRIPEEGTQWHFIYELMGKDWSVPAIAAYLEVNVNEVHQARWRIMNPDKSNANRYRQKHR